MEIVEIEAFTERKRRFIWAVHSVWNLFLEELLVLEYSRHYPVSRAAIPVGDAEEHNSSHPPRA